jgi:MFS family permease
VLGGVMSDKIGPINAIFVVFVLQMLNMIGFIYYGSLAMLIVGIILIGFTFGTILSVFPAITAGQYGLKNFGANYGLMFIAWGLSGAVAPVIADYFYDIHKNFNTAYLLCAMVMVVLIFVNYLLKRNLTKIKN